jgi:hypothetical protein
MPATVTLSTTTLGPRVGASGRSVQVASTSGLIPGIWLFCDGELMSVVRLGVGTDVTVLRGQGGTRATEHASGATIYIGRPDQFYSSDPVGRPPDAIPVDPHINAANGAVWFATGAGDTRRWERQVATTTAGPLGVSVTTLSPTSST